MTAKSRIVDRFLNQHACVHCGINVIINRVTLINSINVTNVIEGDRGNRNQNLHQDSRIAQFLRGLLYG